jgi:hypothetical protein
MPYFINIGRFNALKGVMGARGWYIGRTGTTVHVSWGPIEVRNYYPKRFVWAARPTAQTFKKSTVEAAKKEMQRRLAEKQGERRANGDKAYQRLPPGQKILDKPRQSRKP